MAIELRIAHDQTVGHRDTHPAVLDYVNGQSGLAGGEITIDFQIVVNATECCFDGWRNRFRFSGRCGVLQRSVFAHGEYNPAVSSSLSRTGNRAADDE